MNQSDKVHKLFSNFYLPFQEIAINVESVDHSGGRKYLRIHFISLEIIQQLHIIFQEIFTKEFLDSDPILQRQVNNPLSLPTSAIYQVLGVWDTTNSLIVLEDIIDY